MDLVARFAEYAVAFEKVFENDDWSLLEPFFTADAVYETVGPEPFAGRHEGQRAVFQALKASLDGLDRRFETRNLSLLEGPTLEDGAVWLRWRAVYAAEGVPELVIEGEERAWFEGDRIARLEDRFGEESARAALEYFNTHGSQLL